MNRSPATTQPRAHERGTTLIELMVALVVVALGVLAVSQLFPAGARTQTRERMTSQANLYAQQQLEQLSVKTWGDPAMTVGRHPAGTATESLGNGSYERWYDVTAMAAPLDNLRRVTVSVRWNWMGNPRTVTATTYLRR